MRQLIKQILWVLFVAVSPQLASAFSLGGPIGNNADSSWQIPEIDYSLGYHGMIDAPKNWGEGYRRDTPVVYYGFDATFSSASSQGSLFGTNAGPAAVDAAFAIMNSLTNVSDYSTALSEFPLDTRQQNYSAYNLGMIDLKSITLGLIVEQMGLADPAYYAWTLHNRQGPANSETCPAGMSYSVVMRNFDPSSFADETSVYSPYVNDTLYSYHIFEFCSAPGTPPNAIIRPYAVDIEADAYSAVASAQNGEGFNFGQYYTGLTRDDVAGIRYLIQSNNIPVEDGPLNSFQIVTNVLAPQLLSTTNFGEFLASLTNDPATLLTNFPGLEINFVATNYVVTAFPTVSYYYTNQSVMPFITNSVIPGVRDGFYSTNQPGPTFLNFDGTSFATLTTMDLGLFIDQALTNDPVTLQTLYPALDIVNYTVRSVPILVTNYISYLTNVTGSPYGNPIPVTVPYQIGYELATNWIYTFGNVVTNHFYTTRLVTVQNIFSGFQGYGAPYGSPITIQTNYSHFYTNHISGDFFLIPTNWCGFYVTNVYPVSVLPPYTYSYTNTIIYGGLTTNNTATGTTNLPSTSQFGYIRNYLSSSTNYIFAAYPEICEPELVIATNYSTNLVAEYEYYFGNLFTNFSSSSNYTYVRVTITNTIPVLGGAPGQVTNIVTTTNYYAGAPGGDFLIYPANWCGGLNILANYFTNTVYVTNFFVVTNNNTAYSNGATFSETIITQYTNDTYLVQPLVCSNVPPAPEQRQGVERIQFVRVNYDSDDGYFFTPFTNTFTLVTETNYQYHTETFTRLITRPDLLFSAEDLVWNPGDPGLGNPLVGRSISFNNPDNVLAGEAGPGVILPQSDFIFNKGGPVLDNYSDLHLMDGESYLNGYSSANSLFGSYFVWASYDSSTNLPVVYPQNLSLTNLANQALFRLSPPSLPDATNGAAAPYNQQFTIQGGTPPYLLTVLPANGLPAGFSLNETNLVTSPNLDWSLVGDAVIPPAIPGIYDFILQLSDSGGLEVQYNYSITIH